MPHILVLVVLGFWTLPSISRMILPRSQVSESKKCGDIPRSNLEDLLGETAGGGEFRSHQRRRLHGVVLRC